MTPLLDEGGENTEIKFIRFLLLLKEEYPDRSVRGRWLTFETFSSSIPIRDLGQLLHQGKLETESKVGVGSREGIGNKRIVHCMVEKQLKVEPVAKYIVG